MTEPERPTGSKKPTRSRSAKAGLIMPVSRIDKRMRTKSLRVAGTASVYLAGVLQYLVDELASAAAAKAGGDNRRRINEKDLSLGIRADPELNRMTSSILFFTGDVLRNIPKAVKLQMLKPPPTAV